jgi:hypothetical protein
LYVDIVLLAQGEEVEWRMASVFQALIVGSNPDTAVSVHIVRV